MQHSRKRRAGWRALMLGTLVVGLYAATTVAPATAGTHSHEADNCGIFAGLNSLGSTAAAARGGELREPALNQVVQEAPASTKAKRASVAGTVVPVYFHVVHNGGVGNISDSIINAQMDVLNAAFAGFYGGAATGFSFELAGVTRTDNAEWYFAGPTTSGEREMKQTLHQGGWNALNLYSTTAGGYLGWAYFPGLPESQQYLDGIVVDWESMPHASRTYRKQYDLGHTATHEAGHWFHLHHTFNGGCNNWGDYVDDTPPQRIATFGCPEGQDSCREPGLDPIHNYMDYSFDACYNQFTAGQVVRMQDAWLAFRA